ncbi:hypothetical protein SHIRM173S_00316 [Streptomyces hirsutus]
MAAWAEEHLEKPEQPLSVIEQVEDSLTLLARRQAAAILWVLKSRQEVTARALARIVIPDGYWTNIYPPLRQLIDDGLVMTAGNGQPYRLSRAGDALGPVFGALSLWSAGRPLDHAARHPLWGDPPPDLRVLLPPGPATSPRSPPPPYRRSPHAAPAGSPASCSPMPSPPE